MDKIGEVLNQKLKLIEETETLKGHPIGPNVSRNDLVQLFMEHHMDPVRGSALCQYSFETPPYEPCAKSLSALKKIKVNDFLVGTPHRGSYILLRFITPIDRSRFLFAVAEDEDGDAILVQLFNQKYLPMANKAEMWSTFIIKEPLVDLVAWGELGVRVDHSSDVQCLADYDNDVPVRWRRGGDKEDSKLAEVWKATADNLYHRCYYEQSIDW